MELEIGTSVVNTKTGMQGFVKNLGKDAGNAYIVVDYNDFVLTNNGDGGVIKIVSKGEMIYNYPEAFEIGELEVVFSKWDMKSCVYDEYAFIYNTKHVIKCKELNVKQWTRIGEWNVTNPNEEIVVFPFEHRIMLDQTTGYVAFTKKSNFDKLGIGKFNLYDICRIGKVRSFKNARNIVSDFLGYKQENIFEMDGDCNKIYTRIGINNL